MATRSEHVLQSLPLGIQVSPVLWGPTGLQGFVTEFYRGLGFVQSYLYFEILGFGCLQHLPPRPHAYTYSAVRRYLLDAGEQVPLFELGSIDAVAGRSRRSISPEL